MKRQLMILGLAVLIATLGCGGPQEPTGTSSEDTAAAVAMLDPPFTAEQIRDEWVHGFQLRVRRWTPGGEVRERWTVVYADDEKADIQTFTLDADGVEIWEPKVETSTWAELRDHASFPEDRTKRKSATRDTALGTLDGWLYTVDNPKAGTVTELFFAEDLPGAPVFFRVLEDDEVVMEFEQLERTRPPGGRS